MTKKKNGNIGIKILMGCGVIAVLVIIGCVFFPEIVFGFLR